MRTTELHRERISESLGPILIRMDEVAEKVAEAARSSGPGDCREIIER
jgi:hypothetical protein